MKRYDKLVRDNIPAIIKDKGLDLTFHKAKTDEYYRKLKEKLFEEVIEYEKSEEIEELADILEVIYAIADFKKINKQKFENIRKDKAKKHGAFKERIILEKVMDKKK